MPRSDVATRRLPRLPLFGWAAFAGKRQSSVPCILDRPNIMFTSSGRAAIALALRDLAIGAADRVLVPTYHCPTMIAPVVAAGARPLFFPVDAAGTPRIDAIGDWDLSRVRAMIAAHYFGLPQPMSRIRQFCDERGIALIEDCAHAMFGEADGRPIGTWGHYAIASLTKFLPTSDGGCLIYGDGPKVAPILRRRSLTDQVRSIANTIETGANYERLPGINGLIAGGFAAANALRRIGRRSAPPQVPGQPTAVLAGATQFAPGSAVWAGGSAWSRWIAGAAHRERIVARRRRNYRHLAALLADVPGTRVLQPELAEAAVPYVFPLWVATPARSYHKVRNAGIPVFRWDDVWPGIPKLPGDCGQDWSVHVFQLGCHQDLDLDDLAFMVDTLREIIAAADA
jgi:perosamine synthetase